ncbi:unnamed protein product, partial [Callosobruchus maculatus]
MNAKVTQLQQRCKSHLSKIWFQWHDINQNMNTTFILIPTTITSVLVIKYAKIS